MSIKKNNAGFSLIELLIAIFFISIVLVAIASSMVRVASALWETKARAVAVNMAQNCIEDINFINKSLSWYEFYNKVSTGLGNLCTDNTGLQVSSTAITPSAQVSSYSINSPSGSTYTTIQAGPPQNIQRSYADIPTSTNFNFYVAAYYGSSQYPRANVYLGGGGGTTVVNTQVVVVLIEVTWQKFSDRSAADQNRYLVTKQYLQPSTY
jgi:Tfp pilus assembly protein PilV